MNFSKIGLPVIAASLLLAAGCEVEQTQEAEMPDVDLKAEAGQLPDYDIVKREDGRMPDVDVDVEGRR